MHGGCKMSINRIRAFNRFYTGEIGLLTNRFLKSEYSLVQARILFELSHASPLYAADLVRKLGLSADYVSKTLSRFESQGLITRTPSSNDSRKYVLTLTRAGKAAYLKLKEASNNHISSMIDKLTPEEKSDLVNAMDRIEGILGEKETGLVTIRSHRPGDIGYVIHLHGALYAKEYGFNDTFDAYVAGGMATFIQKQSKNEHLWIAETQERFAGSIAIVHHDDQTAQLRWLIVEPKLRERGIGEQLVSQAVHFAKNNGYKAILLWTVDFLESARRLYANAEFQLTETKTSRIWGQNLTEECWKLTFV